ncbi:hypothetical protein ABDK00_009375 [Niabella insulamsoli]|uniref:hypothetical protein n=1 Tax=Niabella insulamsoli TaxID=3144874 RepID=UPI0031FE1528
MKQDPVLIVDSFRKTAFHFFEEICHNFKEQARKIDRQTDENVFQQLCGRYEQQLQQRLRQKAIDVMRPYNRSDILQLQKSLTEQISYYLLEFKRKVGNL